ncbi:Cfa Cyclopropane fatty acid synthase and related methyltransferases [Rhabdaerophilaceae bacterium]
MLIERVISLAERIPLPDPLIRFGVKSLVEQSRIKLDKPDPAREQRFAADMVNFPVALHTDSANAQHYEVPADFFRLVLGPRRKYSCCFFEHPGSTLADAELHALERTAAHADLRDGMRILELGCGWGSLSLFMAERFPSSRILAVSNSASQRSAILAMAAERNLTNLDVVTADMNTFQPEGGFDRVVSVEMFEHMSNWSELLTRCKAWLAPDGRLFLHVFTHKHASYRFDHTDPVDWIAKHFFTGGIMPSHALPHCFEQIFTVEQEWRWSGEDYAKTARLWLANFDRNADAIDAILRPVYGTDTPLWKRRWRWFFLATEGLFGHASGDVWGVGHYRLRPNRATS